MKQTLFERSARAPLIVAGPGVAAAGRASSRIVEFLDVYPTLAAMAGLRPPDGLHGRSLVPLLKNPTIRWEHGAITQVRRGPADARFAGYSIRTEKWRYTEWDEGKRGTELYDEVADPHERSNLAADPKHQKTVRDLQQQLRKRTRR
jgi:iduronate 2-sulfatase